MSYRRKKFEKPMPQQDNDELLTKLIRNVMDVTDACGLAIYASIAKG